MFDRLNNDLGLQRLIASQGTRDREKLSLPGTAAQQPAPEPRTAAQGPPLGELVRGPEARPIVARVVSQQVVPPLLGPKESEVPEPRLRSSIRGLTEQEELLSAPLPGAPMGAAATQSAQTCIPLKAAAPDAEAKARAAVQSSSHEPRLLDECRALSPGRALTMARRCHTPAARQQWGGHEAAAPVLMLGTILAGSAVAQTGDNPSADPEVSLAGLDALCALTGINPLPAIRWRPTAQDQAGIFEAAAPVAPRGGGQPGEAGLRYSNQVGLIASGLNRALETRIGNPTLSAANGDRAKPKLRFRTERVDAQDSAPAAASMELRALALVVCGAAGGTATLPAEARAVPVAHEIAVGVASGWKPIERGFEMGGLAGVTSAWAEALRPWYEPGTAPLRTEAAAAGVPALGLRPEVPTSREALETEILGRPEAAEDAALMEAMTAEATAAEPAVEAAKTEREEEDAPPLHDQQRRFGVQRPMTKEARRAQISADSLKAAWRAALEAGTSCPRLKLKPDHADGSGSRSNRAESRQWGAMDRFKSVQEKIPGGRFWRSAPADLKWIGLALPLILALVVWSFRGSVAPVEASLPKQPDASKTVIAEQMNKFQRVLLSRAAIRLFDDFRGGLGAWTGSGAGWAKTWKYTDAGFLEPGDLAIYTPTQEMQDYTMEFLGQIERRSMNWIFRAKDLRNYYAMRIVITRGGPLPSASMVRYAVIQGKETSHKTLPLPLSIRPDTVYRVRMDVRGTQFTTSVQGQVVDTFEDTRLPEGGVGFWSPRGDQSLLRWVEVMHQYDYLGRLCALLTPYPLQGGGQQAD